MKHASVEPRYRAVDRFLYPSMATFDKLGGLSILSNIGAVAARGHSLELGLGSTVAMGAAFAFAARRRYANIVELNDSLHFKRIKQPKDKSIGDIDVKAGEFVGELHFGVSRETCEKWKGMHPVARARDAAVQGLDGLLRLAERCQEEDEALVGIVAFRGVSHMVRPSLSRNTEILVSPKEESVLERMATVGVQKISQLCIYGLEGLRIPVGATNELWAMRDGLVQSQPALQQAYERFATV